MGIDFGPIIPMPGKGLFCDECNHPWVRHCLGCGICHKIYGDPIEEWCGCTKERPR